ncbi:MAG: hypothetical protein ABW352_09520 [Polyangiales bacterium]
MRWAAALLVMASLGQASAQDDWALTRPNAVAKQAPWQAELAAARAKALAGEHEAAAEALSALATRVPGARASLRRDAAREWLEAGRPEAAIALLGRGDALEREAYRRAGRGAELAERDERAGRWSAAGEEWERVADDARALIAYERAGDDGARLRVLRKLGRTLELEALATRMLARAPADPSPLITLAELRREAGRREQALALLAAHAHSTSLALHQALHTLYVSWGEGALAESELARLVELAPNEPAHRLGLADAALARGDRERARAEVLRAAKLDGSAAREAHAAELLADRDLLADALTHVALARKREPESYRELEASLLERAGRLAEAERAYQALLAVDARLGSARASEARRRLAGLWRRAGTLDAHLAELRTREDLASLRMLAELYARDPRQLEARRALLGRILSAQPDDHDALRALARAHREAGDLHAAIALAPDALETDEALELARGAPHDPLLAPLLERLAREPSVRVQSELAAVHATRGELGAARAAYARALALDGGADEVRLASIELERANGQPFEPALRVLLAEGTSEAVLWRAAALGERELVHAALLAGAPRRAQRRVLLALGHTLPIALLRGALLEGDERERMQALAQAKDPALLTLVATRQDRSFRERAAALRALDDGATLRALYPTLPRALRSELAPRLARDPAARALLERFDPAVLASDDEWADALFSARAEQRAAAAAVLREREAWPAITRAAQRNPSQLVPHGPGVAPRGLLEAGVCPDRAQVLAFSAALIPTLSGDEHVALRVHAGGARPDSLRGLDRAHLHALLVELAARSELPPGAAEALRADRSRWDWPERMWATRALGQADAREPLKLVRESPSPHTRADACVRAQRAAN